MIASQVQTAEMIQAERDRVQMEMADQVRDSIMNCCLEIWLSSQLSLYNFTIAFLQSQQSSFGHEYLCFSGASSNPLRYRVHTCILLVKRLNRDVCVVFVQALASLIQQQEKEKAALRRQERHVAKTRKALQRQQSEQAGEAGIKGVRMENQGCSTQFVTSL